MKVYIDTREHSVKCSGYERNLINRFKFLGVIIPEPSRFFLYNQTQKVLTPVTKQEVLQDKEQKIIIESCSEWSEIETYII